MDLSNSIAFYIQRDGSSKVESSKTNDKGDSKDVSTFSL